MAFIYNTVQRVKAAAKEHAQLGALCSASLARKSLFVNRPAETVHAELQYILGTIRRKRPYLVWAAEHGQYIEDQVNEHMKEWLTNHPAASRRDAAKVRLVLQNERRAAEYRELPSSVRAEYARRFKEGKGPRPESPEER